MSIDNDIEKAAEYYAWKIKINTFTDKIKVKDLVASAKQDFIEGAKWMQEKNNTLK